MPTEAPDPVSTLRRYLPHLPDVARPAVTQAVDALADELARLRENALDLSEVPEGWHFAQLTQIGDHFECCLTTSGGRFLVKPNREHYDTGPTPRAALAAACARARETT